MLGVSESQCAYQRCRRWINVLLLLQQYLDDLLTTYVETIRGADIDGCNSLGVASK